MKLTEEMSSPYEMTVDLNVLDHLGINLYSNIAAVLTEAVANAWDADAGKVVVVIDPDREWIEIRDDGVGMSVDDMNGKYLRVGYRRRDEDREHGRKTKNGRPVMGRKGLGKLSLFSIAEVIEVQSFKEGTAHGLRMTVDGIKESVAKRQSSYNPEQLDDAKVTVTKGTVIRLEAVKRKRLGQGIDALRKRLARRFSVIGAKYDFSIEIDGHEISAWDRGDLAAVQFLWRFAGSEIDTKSARGLKESEELPNRAAGWKDGKWKVTGWLGTAAKPKDLDNPDEGNLNSIVVFSRGRLFHENILDKLNDGRLYTKYLTGQIEADFLDDDEEPDIATSDRQRIQEDDPRYGSLIAFLKGRLTEVEKRWSEWRRKHEVEKAKAQSPALVEWFGSLGAGHRKSAEELISKLSALPIEDEEDRKVLYKQGILAFERMKIQGSEKEFINGIDSIEKLLSVLADRDVFEASLYRDIVKSRLVAIRHFQKIVTDDDKEKALQEYLFDHMWLLDPAWERATTSELMESRLAEEGVIVEDLTKKEKLGRVDIKYQTFAGKHIIVELKKAGRSTKLHELLIQGEKYVNKLTKILAAQGNGSPNIEVIFVIGKPIPEEATDPDRVKNYMAGIAPGSRIVHYDTLIQGALDGYSEYLAKGDSVDKVQNIVDRI